MAWLVLYTINNLYLLFKHIYQVCLLNFDFHITETGNLIDLSSDGSIANANQEHNYVNDTVIAASRENRREPATFFDAFDMRTLMKQLSIHVSFEVH